MNLVFSYSVQSDHELSQNGFKFLGSGKDNKGSEVHVFSLVELDLLNSDNEEVKSLANKRLDDSTKIVESLASYNPLSNTSKLDTILDRLVTVMNIDNGANFSIDQNDYFRSRNSIKSLLESGFFSESEDEYEDLDSSYWMMSGSEESERELYFSYADKSAFEVLDKILDEIFNRGSKD